MITPALTYLEWIVLQWMAKPYSGSHYGFRIDAKGKASFFEGLTADACAAAIRLKARGWMDADEYGTYRINATGMNAAKVSAAAKPIWTQPAAPALQARDLEVLTSLATLSASGKWVTPLDCGGGSRSHHSASLLKLVRHGYALSRQKGSSTIDTSSNVVRPPHLFPQAKGSRIYQVSEEGLAKADALSKERVQVFKGHRAP